jgi:hypothetical protein
VISGNPAVFPFSGQHPCRLIVTLVRPFLLRSGADLRRAGARSSGSATGRLAGWESSWRRRFSIRTRPGKTVKTGVIYFCIFVFEKKKDTFKYILKIFTHYIFRLRGLG